MCLVLPAACCLLIAGCGGSAGFEVAPVSGRVTLDNQPLENIQVNFQPVSGGETSPGPGSYGLTDSDGQFTLMTVQEDSAAGAVVGDHTVTLIYKDPTLDESTEGEEVETVFKLPPKARDRSMTFTVPAEGTDQANFEF